jgi:hypothetical protein
MLPFTANSNFASSQPAIVRTLTEGDVSWCRRAFKAPPLDVKPPVVNLAELLLFRQDAETLNTREERD